jgi:GT2 family glycosyltransferase
MQQLPGDDAATACELSVIMISYNTREITLAALETFYAHRPDIAFEMIIIDNASHDGSADAIEQRFPRARLIRSQDNTGFAAANNYAATLARGRRLLLLNPDTLHLDDATGKLWDFAERTPERGIWGGRTLFADHSLNPTSCWGRMSIWSLFCSASGLTAAFRATSLFNPEGYGGWLRDSERSIDIVTGCFFLIDAVLWRRLGGFDPLFFMYAEEADLCTRAIGLGARPGITPTATIVHYGGASEVSGAERMIKVMRGRATLMRKHWRDPAVTVGSACFRLWALSRLVHAELTATAERDKWRTIWRRRREWIGGY